MKNTIQGGLVRLVWKGKAVDSSTPPYMEQTPASLVEILYFFQVYFSYQSHYVMLTWNIEPDEKQHSGWIDEVAWKEKGVDSGTVLVNHLTWNKPRVFH